MKKFFILLLLIPISLSAQEKYFHELKGMEDSTGTTHLFYRVFEETSFQCGPGNNNYIARGEDNDVYHYNISSQIDSLKIHSGWSEWCIPGMFDGIGVDSYTFLNNDPNSLIFSAGYECTQSVKSISGKSFPLYFPCIIKRNINQRSISWDHSGIIYHPLSDHIYIYFNAVQSYLKLKSDPNNWFTFSEEDFEGFEENKGVYFEFIDSVSIGLDLITVHPTIDSIYYARDITDSLKTSGFEVIIPDLNINTLKFDSNPSIIYSIHYSGGRKLSKSENFGRSSSWSDIPLPSQLTRLLFLETDAANSGFLFVADSNSVYSSFDYGSSFETTFLSEVRITGLYKKPDSNILYVLTTDELFEINTETKESTSLKKLPVSNETPKEIPTSITLHQNYPNPFNPTTTISFELDKPSEVKLTIFDTLGRTIATLVNEQRSIGLHTVSFDASNLSSGIYFYSLKTGEFYQTKRLTLIK